MKNIDDYKYQWRYYDNERPRGMCYDCKIPYSSFCDLYIKDELWERINPTDYSEAGLLCPNCILQRLNYIGVIDFELIASDKSKINEI